MRPLVTMGDTLDGAPIGTTFSEVTPDLPQTLRITADGFEPREKVLEVAHNYGLKHATHYQDYAIKHDTVNPFRAAKSGGTSHTAVAVASGKETFSGKAKINSPGGGMGRGPSPAVEEPFAAILVMCDPYEWYVCA